MNNNILISAGVLQNYWEYERKDTIDLLLPFLKCSIAKQVKVNEIINIELLAKDFKESFGYDDIPLDVIFVMLNRLTPAVLTKKDKHYTLSSSLDNEVTKFNKKRNESRSHCDYLIKKLSEHLSKAFLHQEFSEEKTIELLYNFFISHGLCFAKNKTDDLQDIKRKNNQTEYEIARFIISESKKDTLAFQYLTEMIQGFFVSTALSIENASSSTKAKMRGLSCYIDTRIIIDALGFHLPSISKDSTIEFLNMLKASGARLFCFTHNYNEIRNVLNAYKASIKNINNYNEYNTLEALDEQGCTANEVDDILAVLSSKIENLGISIIDKPAYDNSYVKEAYIDATLLESKLKSEMHYKSYTGISGLQADIDSICGIMLLRNGRSAVKLEQSGYIFVSSNYRYCRIVAEFMKSQYSNCMPVTYSETELASLLWLRNYSTHKDYPKSKLIENAMMTIDVPSQQFLFELSSKIEKMEQQGGISADEASVLRSDHFTKKELLQQSKGDSDKITEESILDARDKLRQKYVKEESQKSELNLRMYQQQKENNDLIKRNARKRIQEMGEKQKAKTIKRLTLIAKICAITIFLPVIAGFIYGIDVSSTNAIAFSVIIFIFNVYSLFDLFVGKKSKIHDTIVRIGLRKADKVMDEEKEKMMSIFESEV